MSEDLHGSYDPLGVFDDPRYARQALDLAPTYQAADPFPHIVIDDFLPDALARQLSATFPTHESIDWVVRDNENNRRVYQHDETKVPRLHRQMLREFNSRQFLLFIETLTGIDSLLPDPYFIGGGIHLSGPGDFLKIHADFNWHHKLQAHRRVNALLYLPERWEPEWGGAIEFWDRDMTHAVDHAYPKMNRLVVFSTSEHSNHGQRVPNSCPPDHLRKVINLYYYTTQRDDADGEAAPHFTLYKNEAYQPQASSFAMELGDSYRATAESAAPPP
jgi:Rps23 Pro-64 3,4-dihydroxylase Tpa1-like proline 4-hydroxylase